MDCFSSSSDMLSVHSPSSRLLFAKDVARLRPLASAFIKRIKKSQPNGSLQDQMAIFAEILSSSPPSCSALHELLSWIRTNAEGVQMVGFSSNFYLPNSSGNIHDSAS
ncbi:hypothetical protein WR25_23657 isoform B [Diploscapter pachys]|uniref:Plexin cytoplasmic RasGAP domain-containing protein n=1 Tax=Diploscapter pachys TaxID=2018661 RepID=A0A2A2K4G2_9BILA|nr:hypothetical protein WR25_23657 isoform B [Diploscapter pachys]